MNVKRFTFPDTVPLTQWADGSVRVINSRVTLETLVACLDRGDTVEEIHEGFPTVSLEQINAIIGWYVEHKAEADEYIREGEAEEEKFLQEWQSRPESIASREKLRALREQMLKN